MIDIKNNEINIVNILLGGTRKRVAIAKSAAAAQVKGLKLPNGEYFLTIPEWDFENESTTVNDDVLTLFDGDWTYTYNEDTEQYEDDDDDFYIKILSFDNTNLIYTIDADGASGTIILNSEEEPEQESESEPEDEWWPPLGDIYDPNSCEVLITITTVIGNEINFVNKVDLKKWGEHEGGTFQRSLSKGNDIFFFCHSRKIYIGSIESKMALLA